MNIKPKNLLIVLLVIVVLFGLRWIIDRADRVMASDIYKTSCNQELFKTLEAYEYTIDDVEISPTAIQRTWTYYHVDGSRVGGLLIILEKDLNGELKFVSQKCIP